MINQSALCKLIKANGRDIVNLNNNGFQYCNGYMMAECDYEMERVISKLLKVRALSAGKELKPTRTQDLSKIIETTNEVLVLRTEYMRVSGDKVGYVFKVNGEFYTYSKDLVDVFEGVTYTAVVDGEKVILKVYQGTKFEGLILNMRIKADVKMEMQEFEA